MSSRPSVEGDPPLHDFPKMKFKSRRDLACKFLHSFADSSLPYRNAGFPWFVYARQSQCAASEREITHETPHVGLAFVWVVVTPEVVHDWRNAGEKSDDGSCAQFGLNAEQETRSADNQRYPRCHDRGFRSRNTFRLNIKCHLMPILEMVDVDLEEVSAEDHAA